MGQRFYRRAAALSVAAAASRAAAATYVSTYIPAGSSTWNTPANWSNVPAVTGFPNNGANTWDAIIPGVGVGATEASLSSNITINNFNLSNADLVGAAPDGTTVQANPVSLTVNGNFTNLGVSDRFLKGIVLNLPGTAIVSGGGNFDGDANAAINVSGVLTKDDTGYDQFYNPAVSVSGTVNVMQGALVINNSATQSGTFNVAAGALLQLTGDFTAASLLNVSGEADLLATPGTTAIPGLDNPATGRGFAGTLRVAANATLGFASNGYGGGGYYFTPSSHLSFGSGSTLTVGNYAGTTFADADDLNIATINLNSQTTFRTNSLTAGVVNTTGAETNTIRFETSTAGSGVAIGTLNQAGATIRTGQDDGLPITPVNVATFNLSAGTVGGRIVVSSAANWTGGLVGCDADHLRHRRDGHAGRQAGKSGRQPDQLQRGDRQRRCGRDRHVPAEHRKHDHPFHVCRREQWLRIQRQRRGRGDGLYFRRAVLCRHDPARKPQRRRRDFGAFRLGRREHRRHTV
jgi:hypothetical protein